MTPPGPTVAIGKASGHELLVVLACAAWGISTLFITSTQSAALAVVLTSWGVLAYGVGQLVGAAAVVFGAALTDRALREARDVSDGLKLERAGLLLSGPLMAAYAAAVFLAGSHGVFNGAVCTAIAAAHIARALRIGHDLAALRVVVAVAGVPEQADGAER